MASAACYNPVRNTKDFLKRYEDSPASLSVHLYPSHWTLNQSKAFSYTGPLASFLKSVQGHSLPVDLLSTLDEAGIRFYDGCLIVEVIKHEAYSDPTTKSEKDEVARQVHEARLKPVRRVLWPSAESRFIDIATVNAKTGFSLSDSEALHVEAKILLATAPPLCLEPDPVVTRIANTAVLCGSTQDHGELISAGIKRKRGGSDTMDNATRETRARMMESMNPRAGKPLTAKMPQAAIVEEIRRRRAHNLQPLQAPPPPLPQPPIPPPQLGPMPAPDLAEETQQNRAVGKKKAPAKGKKAAPVAKPEPPQGLQGLPLPSASKQPTRPAPPPINTNVSPPNMPAPPSILPTSAAGAGKKKPPARASARPAMPLPPTAFPAVPGQGMPIQAFGGQPTMAQAGHAAAVAPMTAPSTGVAPVGAVLSALDPGPGQGPGRTAASGAPPKKKAKPNPAPRPPSVPTHMPTPVAAHNRISPTARPPSAALGAPGNFSLSNSQAGVHMGVPQYSGHNIAGNFSFNMPNVPTGQLVNMGGMTSLPMHPSVQQGSFTNAPPTQPAFNAPARPPGNAPIPFSDVRIAQILSNMPPGVQRDELQKHLDDPELLRAMVAQLAQPPSVAGNLQVPPPNFRPAAQQARPNQPQMQPHLSQQHLQLQQPQPQQHHPMQRVNTPAIQGQQRLPTPATQNQRIPTPAGPQQRIATPATHQQRMMTPAVQNTQANMRATPNMHNPALVAPNRMQGGVAPQARVGFQGPMNQQPGMGTPHPRAMAAPHVQQWSPAQQLQYQAGSQQPQPPPMHPALQNMNAGAAGNLAAYATPQQQQQQQAWLAMQARGMQTPQQAQAHAQAQAQYALHLAQQQQQLRPQFPQGQQGQPRQPQQAWPASYQLNWQNQSGQGQ